MNDEVKQIQQLAQRYIDENIIPKKFLSDALHLAVATVNEIDILVSWNYKHLVKLNTIKKVKSINILEGYKTLDIITPLNL